MENSETTPSPAVALPCLVLRLRNYLGQLDTHQRKREAAKLITEALAELKQVEAIFFGGFLEDTPENGIAWRAHGEAMELKREAKRTAEIERRLRALHDNMDPKGFFAKKIGEILDPQNASVVLTGDHKGPKTNCDVAAG